MFKIIIKENFTNYRQKIKKSERSDHQCFILCNYINGIDTNYVCEYLNIDSYYYTYISQIVAFFLILSSMIILISFMVVSLISSVVVTG